MLTGKGNTEPQARSACGFSMDYGSAKWKKKREKILRLDRYICQVGRWYGRREEATIVHHIYPAKEYPEYQWCTWNLISVSVRGHALLENSMTGGLTKLGEKLKDKTIPGVDWRSKRKNFT